MIWLSLTVKNWSMEIKRKSDQIALKRPFRHEERLCTFSLNIIYLQAVSHKIVSVNHFMVLLVER